MKAPEIALLSYGLCYAMSYALLSSILRATLSYVL